MCKLKFLRLFRDKLCISLGIYFRVVLSLGFKYVCIEAMCEFCASFWFTITPPVEVNAKQ